MYSGEHLAGCAMYSGEHLAGQPEKRPRASVRHGKNRGK
jgi:hypothetical protein